MRFGTTYEEDLKQQAAGGGGGDGRYIKYFKQGDTSIRFLEELPDWTPYWEHYDPSAGTNGASFPCTGDRKHCPGCISPNVRVSKASKKYLVNGLVGEYTDLYKVPQSLIERIQIRADRDGASITKRNFLITRSGDGKDTEYDIEREEREPIDVESYRDKFWDHQEALQEAFIEAHGALPDDPDDNQDAPKPKAAPRRRAKSADEVEFVSKPLDQVKVVQAEDPPSEPQQERVAAEGAVASTTVDKPVEDDDEVEMTEDQLRAMKSVELRVLFKQCSIEPPDTDDVDALVDALIKALS